LPAGRFSTIVPAGTPERFCVGQEKKKITRALQQETVRSRECIIQIAVAEEPARDRHRRGRIGLSPEHSSLGIQASQALAHLHVARLKFVGVLEGAKRFLELSQSAVGYAVAGQRRDVLGICRQDDVKGPTRLLKTAELQTALAKEEVGSQIRWEQAANVGAEFKRVRCRAEADGHIGAAMDIVKIHCIAASLLSCGSNTSGGK